VRSLIQNCVTRPAEPKEKCSKTIEAGEVAEWLMAPVLKTGMPERVSGVRIPPSPPDFLRFYFHPLAQLPLGLSSVRHGLAAMANLAQRT
jgi:hypothetical protein